MPNIYIRAFGTKEIVYTVDATSKTARWVEATVAGLLYNMDKDRFYVDDSEVGVQHDEKMRS